jgi:ABC-type phosphate/phosphonate transport system substrate-binding protein
MTRSGLSGLLGPLVRSAVVLIVLCAQDGTAAEPPLMVRFGLPASMFYEVSLKDAEVALELWARQIVAGAARPFQASGRVIENTELLAAATARGELDVIGFSTLEYLRWRERLPIDPVFIGGRDHEPTDEHWLVVRRDSGVTKLSALAGKRVILPAGNVGQLSRIWLDAELAKEHQGDAARFFGEIRTASKLPQTLLPVFFRQADAAVITRAGYGALQEMNPQLGRDLVTIAVSPKLLASVVCFHRHMDEGLRAMVTDGSLGLADSAAGRQILLLFKVKRVVRFEPVYLEGVAGLLRNAGARRGAEHG